MFWSLSQLRNLKSLMMDVYYTKYESSKHYPPEAYLAILDCCTHVRELIAGGMFLEPTEVAGLYVKSSVMQRMSKVLRPLRENAPATALEAMAAVERSSSHERSRSTGSRLSILKRSSVRMATFHSKSHSDSMKAAAVSPVEVPSRSVTYQIRRLELKSSRMDIDVFCTLTSRCTLLEELVLDGLWIRITDDTWRTLAVKCPRLRTLKVCGSGDQYLPSTQTLITIFPRLETLSLMTIEFRTDPDLSNLGTTLQTIKQAQGDTHPLKSIHLSGSILKPLKVLLDIVTQSSTVESLSVGFTLTAMRDIAQEPGMPYELKKRWLCQESLMHLDLTSIAFQDKKIFSKVFGHIQRLPRLRSLRISVSHIREAWFFTTRSRSRGEPRNGRSSNREGASPLTYSISSSSTPDLRGLSSNGSRSRRTGFFCFSALEVLRIGVPYFVNNNSFETPIVFDEVVYMINASPRLKQVELKHLSESGMIKRLSGAYPRMEFS
ncbi:hypothetical protein BGZ54_008198 [Gamsiella multidivaricata]|nr:hypothetical protein BGZ54_008198 [Gamsiella multidivaricata]